MCCDSDSYLSSNTSGVLTCFKCPSGATPDNTNKTCTCPANKFYSSGNNTCTTCLSNSPSQQSMCVRLRLLPEFEHLWSSNLFQVPIWSHS
ncbi:Growth_factor receptor cysteine-rich domain superfamily [Hexamita inflata]|uniref:Growth factor receptor cysteine-rich domain superfamily n=1 Tax=Hexamita inflata TaxID=28002 RepID=A0AA86U0F3_9EUKA|nr:Growth factor receptor cysteine-rich domain superfamily [Hexamita inflata]